MSTLVILALTPAAVALACWQGWQYLKARRQFKADMDRLDQWANDYIERQEHKQKEQVA